MHKNTLVESLNNFVAFLEKQNLSRSSVKNYRNDIMQFIDHIGDNFVDEDTVNNYLQYLEEKYSSISTYNRKVTSIKKFLKFMDIPFFEKLNHKSSLINNYRNYVMSYNKNKRTVKNYVSDVNKFLKWLNVNNIQTEKLSPDTIYIYKNYLSSHLKENSVRRHISSIKSFYEYLDENTNRITPTAVTDTNYNRWAFILLLAMLTISFTQRTSLEVYKDEISPDLGSMSKLSRTYSLTTPLYFKPVKISLSLQDTVDNKVPHANSFEIVKPALAAENYINSSGKENNVSNGKSMIKSGSTSTIIYSDTINSNSIVQITPTSNTQNQILFIEKQSKGFFKVSINQRLENDITFNWSVSDLYNLN